MRPAGAIATLAFGIALGGCFSAVRYGCEDDAQCRVGEAAGVCTTQGVCAYDDDGCESGLRFGPFAGDFSGTCVDPAGTSGGMQPSDTSESTSTESSSTAMPTTSMTADASSTGVGCTTCGMVLWTTTDVGVGVLHGVAVSSGELVAVGEVDGEEWVGRYSTEDGSRLSAMETTGLGGIAWDVATISDEAFVVVGERPAPGDAGVRGVVMAYANDFSIVWSDVYESGGDDRLRAVVWTGDRVVSVGAAGEEGVLLGHDVDGNRQLDRRITPEGASVGELWAASPGPSGASLGGTSDAQGWVVRLVGSSTQALPDPPLQRVLGVASLDPQHDVVVGVGGGDGAWAVMDGSGQKESERLLPGGALTSVARLPTGGWIAVGTDGDGAPWFTLRDVESEEIIEGPVEDMAAQAEDVVVDDGVAYVVGGGDSPWLAAVAVE